MKNLPSVESYSQNTPRANCIRVEVGELSLWYSYNTVVAFRSPKTGKVVRVNDWSVTTGKHLNWIDGGNKSARISGEEFEKQLAAVLQSYSL